jgi:aspartyl-tRNA(Asn)/glutamyl-tRNA(Gln) amidotransferase subunit B
MRCDVNVSVRHVGGDLRTRTETKNVNSMRFAMQAVVFEAERQVALYEDGGKVTQETRLFDASTGETRSMRSKEEAHDYRYFPDPDLLPLVITQEYVDAIAATLPELPDAKQARFMDAHGLGHENAALLVADKETADYFEAVLAAGGDAKLAANWTLHELFAVLNRERRDIGDSPVAAADLGKLVGLIHDGTISGRIAKDVFEIMLDSGGDPETIVADKGLKQITDTGAIEVVIDRVIADNPEQAQQVRDGNPKVGGWFVGQVMQATGGKANPAAVNELLKKKLG